MRILCHLLIGFICCFIAPLAHANTFKDIAYTAFDHPEQRLDIYTPLTPRTNAPVIVYVHGGAWIIGDKALKPPQSAAYTGAGNILISLNYRLAPDHKYPANIDDIYAAHNWIKKNIHTYGGDPENMVLVGHSAGAHLVALAAVGPDDRPPLSKDYRAIIPVDSASYDITRRGNDNLHRIVKSARRKTFDRKDWREASPIYQIEHASNDGTYHIFAAEGRSSAVHSSKELHDALNRIGHNTALSLIPDVTHREIGQQIFEPASQIYQAIKASLNKAP